MIGMVKESMDDTTVAELLKKMDKTGVETVDTLIQYAKHVEKRNEELFDSVRGMEARTQKYVFALTKIKLACKGCPAYYIAMEALMDVGTGDDGGGEI